jgi:hypothetical protein
VEEAEIADESSNGQRHQCEQKSLRKSSAKDGGISTSGNILPEDEPEHDSGVGGGSGGEPRGTIVFGVGCSGRYVIGKLRHKF